MPPEQDGTAGRTTLPLLGQPATERADAARNRQAVLTAARTMMINCGVDALCMDRVAEHAGVGIGTVYRRFGDRAGLVYALLDDDERRFQAAFLFGPPPLGPGAPPVTRIRAFLHAYVDRLDTHATLLALAESKGPAARLSNGAFQTHRAHLIAQLALAGHTDPAYLADALMAVLAAGLFLHQREQLQYSTGRIKAGLDQLLAGVAPTVQPAAAAASTP